MRTCIVRVFLASLIQCICQGDNRGDGIHYFMRQYPYQFLPGFHFFILQCAVDVFQTYQAAGSSLQLDVSDRQGEVESGVPFLQVRYLLVFLNGRADFFGQMGAVAQ